MSQGRCRCVAPPESRPAGPEPTLVGANGRIQAYWLRFTGPDQRRGQLAAGGDDEVPVVDPGKALGLALTAMVRR